MDLICSRNDILYYEFNSNRYLFIIHFEGDEKPKGSEETFENRKAFCWGVKKGVERRDSLKTLRGFFINREIEFQNLHRK